MNECGDIGNLPIQGRGKVRSKVWASSRSGKTWLGNVGEAKAGAILNSRQNKSVLAKSGQKPRPGYGRGKIEA